MADVLNQIVDKVKESDNILVTVSSNPSVDELSAALGITLLINKMNKHATAVFSGKVPSVMEFLHPEKTFENTVDSLRDFIIALNKEKADHLRYKVVDDMVKIFITPYRTTISEGDLEFSQGDYNVEMVLAIGVKDEADLDRALESHGRILHDATVAAIALGESTQLGTLEWSNPRASSYSEMLCQLADVLRDDKKLIDEQIATAFLTGIVAATERFSNAQTNSAAMTIAAQLMAAGANQQLIATRLQEARENPQEKEDSPKAENAESKKEEKAKKTEDDSIGSLQISHEPEGDVDEVKKEIQEKKSDEALKLANEQLERRKSNDAAAAAEKKLAEQLAAVPKAPTVEEIKKDLEDRANDISEESENLSNSAPEIALPPVSSTVEAGPGPASMSAPMVGPGSPPQNINEPSLGGTLNATTEQAAEDARRAAEDDRNRVILSHDHAPTTSQPSTQSPFNAVTSNIDTEPSVRDVFAEAAAPKDESKKPNTHGITVQPVAPGAGGVGEPPVATRAQDEARAAVDAAFGSMPQVEANANQAVNQFVEPSLPQAPAPPMPDFSTLPPLPPADASAPSGTLESTLPPAPQAAPPAPATNDPAQFRIPGQA